ncbi:TlpA family protein disulfide reductase [Tuberibacillus sp. Marseille-P3662]|uniref:TlpA family protein disulfide reductase n=1 Tax=Tuberibacillus sp. Marseille-P3662 TaxID=1965358 RepID=UPI000A1CD6E0|nr:TlpA disulfide reductase family protein [Tuberibacillus sp. Marseille-P3662]
MKFNKQNIILTATLLIITVAAVTWVSAHGHDKGSFESLTVDVKSTDDVKKKAQDVLSDEFEENENLSRVELVLQRPNKTKTVMKINRDKFQKFLSEGNGLEDYLTDYYTLPGESKTTSGTPYKNDFDLKNLKGEKVSLSDYKSEKVLLNFWATWCHYCRQEMSTLNKFYNQNDVNIVSVNIGESKETVEGFKQKTDFDFITLLDKKADVSESFNVHVLPTSILIDKNGKVLKRHQGPFMKLDDINNFMKDKSS